MKHTTKRHIYYYLSLVFLLGFGFYLVLLFSGDQMKQFVSVLLFATIYCMWGILHQYLEHTLTVKIMVEYVLIGSLGVTIMSLLLL